MKPFSDSTNLFQVVYFPDSRFPTAI